MCQPMPLADTGDYECPVEENDGKSDIIMQPTPESLEAHDEWFERKYVESLG